MRLCKGVVPRAVEIMHCRIERRKVGLFGSFMVMVQYSLRCLQRPNKKNLTANAPASSEVDRPPTPTPSTSITPMHPNTYASNGKGALATAAGGVASSNAAPTSNPSVSQNQLQILPWPEADFNLGYGIPETTGVLYDIDLDPFSTRMTGLTGSWMRVSRPTRLVSR
jgi:hypothetical protein